VSTPLKSIADAQALDVFALKPTVMVWATLPEDTPYQIELLPAPELIVRSSPAASVKAPIWSLLTLMHSQSVLEVSTPETTTTRKLVLA